MKRYEVIIVGAGPAGSSAAYHLASAGVKVGLVDKQTFPRDKVCGDGVVASLLNRLERMGLGNWLRQNSFNAPRELLFSAPNGEALRFVPDDPDRVYGRVIPRLDLDNALVGQAVKAGADLLERVTLRSMTRPGPDTVRLSGDSQSGNGLGTKVQLESKLLITADGAPASFTRTLGLVRGEPDLVAIRAYFENVAGSDRRLEIHYDANLTPGYAWLFPLAGGRANVGLGTFVSRSRRRNVNLKQTLQDFIRRNPYAGRRLAQARIRGPLKGYPIRSQMNTVIPVADNILVAGEAAGLVNPLNGEGIGTAVLSGELAARHALAALQKGDFTTGHLRGYARDLKQYIGRNHFLARLLRNFIAWPGVMNRVVQRAQKDRAFAQNLFEVIVEVKPTRTIFSPRFLAKLIMG